MSLLNDLIRKTEKIDFLFPNSFEELMNSEYYDYDKFEWFLYYLFKLEGAKVQKVGKKGKGDGGADLILSLTQPNGGVRRIGIQAKYWKNRVGTEPINQLASAKSRHDLQDLWIITTSDLTSDAKEIAESLGIKILRGEDVSRFIETVKAYYQKDIEEKGESSIEFLKVTNKKKVTVKKTKESKEADQEIVKKLKELRFNISKKHKLYPVYTVFNNETLSLIIEEKPTTKEALLSIKGLGQKKIDEFGQDICDFVNENLIHDESKNFDVDQNLLELLIKERIKISIYNKIPIEEVYSDKVAGYLAKMKPTNLKTLEKVYGFKKENIALFGDYLINVIAKYQKSSK
jgi:superfamily II DNA helicase RecQ